jgi:hypothetical protein
MRTLAYFAGRLIASKGEIRHPNPRAAVGLGVVMIVGALLLELSRQEYNEWAQR